jgi:hypothetical protein
VLSCCSARAELARALSLPLAANRGVPSGCRRYICFCLSRFQNFARTLMLKPPCVLPIKFACCLLTRLSLLHPLLLASLACPPRRTLKLLPHSCTVAGHWLTLAAVKSARVSLNSARRSCYQLYSRTLCNRTTSDCPSEVRDSSLGCRVSGQTQGPLPVTVRQETGPRATILCSPPFSACRLVLVLIFFGDCPSSFMTGPLL